jgi:hypothetical protein
MLMQLVIEFIACSPFNGDILKRLLPDIVVTRYACEEHPMSALPEIYLVFWILI